MIYNVRPGYAIRLKFGGKLLFFARSESQYLLYNQRKSTFILS